MSAYAILKSIDQVLPHAVGETLLQEWHKILHSHYHVRIDYIKLVLAITLFHHFDLKDERKTCSIDHN